MNVFHGIIRISRQDDEAYAFVKFFIETGKVTSPAIRFPEGVFFLFTVPFVKTGGRNGTPS